MIKEIKGWLSEVTGEILDNEREAFLLDRDLLAKFNTKAVEEHVSKSIASIQDFLKEEISEASVKESDLANNLRDLYQATFDQKVSRSNRYFNANPLDILIELELRYTGLISDMALKATAIANNAENASADYEKEKKEQDALDKKRAGDEAEKSVVAEAEKAVAKP